jgi:TPP-dependent pyruvate/acetoin dehydrogenase alpha subunit
LQARDLLTAADLAAIEASVAAEVDAAVAEAEAGPWEPVEALLDDVHARPAPR